MPLPDFTNATPAPVMVLLITLVAVPVRNSSAPPEVRLPWFTTLPKVNAPVVSKPPLPRFRVVPPVWLMAVVPVTRSELIVWEPIATPVPVAIETLSVLPALLINSGE